MKGISWKDWLYVAEQYEQHKMNSPALLLRLLNCISAQGFLPEVDEQDKRFWSNTLCANSSIGLREQIRDANNTGYLGTRVSHYPGLLTQSQHSLKLLRSQSVYEQLQANRAIDLFASRISFENAISNFKTAHSPTPGINDTLAIAIVGNSPTLLDEENGCEIDNADIVIRFNNAPIVDSIAIHTGSRTDIWVISPSTSTRLCPQDAKIVAISGCYPLDRASFYWRKLPTLGRAITQFPANVWYELVSRFQAPPSAGALVTASLHSYQGNISIRHYGFSRNCENSHLLPNHHADDQPRSSRHNWEAEAKWLSKSTT